MGNGVSTRQAAADEALTHLYCHGCGLRCLVDEPGPCPSCNSTQVECQPYVEEREEPPGSKIVNVSCVLEEVEADGGMLCRVIPTQRVIGTELPNCEQDDEAPTLLEDEEDTTR